MNVTATGEGGLPGGLRTVSMEEGILFPFFEAKTGITGGPTAVMRQEHAGIRNLLERIGSALSASDGAASAASRDELLELLDAHNQKEERPRPARSQAKGKSPSSSPADEGVSETIPSAAQPARPQTRRHSAIT